jgi:hypothetical protein
MESYLILIPKGEIKDKKPIGMEILRKSLFMVVLVQVASLIGCQGVGVLSSGARIRPGYQISIAEGRKTIGDYQTLDLTLYYKYLKTGDNHFRMSGVVRFADSLHYNFSTIRFFHLNLILADAEGNILERRGLRSISSRDPEREVSFSIALRLPEGAMFMGFTYTGRATEGGGGYFRGRDGGMETDFWHYPIIR